MIHPAFASFYIVRHRVRDRASLLTDCRQFDYICRVPKMRRALCGSSGARMYAVARELGRARPTPHKIRVRRGEWGTRRRGFFANRLSYAVPTSGSLTTKTIESFVRYMSDEVIDCKGLKRDQVRYLSGRFSMPHGARSELWIHEIVRTRLSR